MFKAIVKSMKKSSSLLSGIALLFTSYVFFDIHRNWFDTSQWNQSIWFSFIELCIIAITAFIALFAVFHNKKTAVETTTLKIILDDYQDSKVYEAKTLIFDFIHDRLDHSDNLNVTTLTQIYEIDTKKLNLIEKKIKSSLMLLLNRYEFFAIGINTGILDERLFKRMHYTNIIYFWETVSPVIMCIRKKVGQDSLFKDFEILVTRWKLNPLHYDDF